MEKNYTRVLASTFTQDFDSLTVESRYSADGTRFQFVNFLDEEGNELRTVNFPKDLAKVTDIVPVGDSNEEVADAIIDNLDKLSVLKTASADGRDYYVLVAGSNDFEKGANRKL